MALTYREWQEGDDLKLLEIFTDPDDHQVAVDRSMLQGPSQDPWVESIVVCDDGIPVGAGVCFQSTLHPDRCWIYVEVAAALRGQGVGRELVRRLTEAHAREVSAGRVPGELKARFAVDPESGEALNPAAAALAAPLQPIQTSRMIEIAPKAVPMPDFEDTSAGTRHLTDLATGSVELTQAVHAFYVGVHEEWDRADLSVGRTASMLLSPQAGAHGALVLRSGRELPENPPEGAKPGRIRAFAVSYAAAAGTEHAASLPSDVLLGCDLSLDEDQQIRALADLIGPLVADHPILVEVDESMHALTRIVKALLADGTARVVSQTSIVAGAL
jgi:GNAT superfamily N-acetyltransferase